MKLARTLGWHGLPRARCLGQERTALIAPFDTLGRG